MTQSVLKHAPHVSIVIKFSNFFFLFGVVCLLNFTYIFSFFFVQVLRNSIIIIIDFQRDKNNIEHRQGVVRKKMADTRIRVNAMLISNASMGQQKKNFVPMDSFSIHKIVIQLIPVNIRSKLIAKEDLIYVSEKKITRWKIPPEVRFFLLIFRLWNFPEPPLSTPECPRSYGYYRLGDSKNCGNFINCVAGRGYRFECPLGLAFNELTLHCDWPDQVASCDAEGIFLACACVRACVTMKKWTRSKIENVMINTQYLSSYALS